MKFKEILVESITLEKFKKFLNELKKSLKEEYFIVSGESSIEQKFKDKDELRLVSKSGNMIIIDIKNKNIKIFNGSKGAGWNSPTYTFNIENFDKDTISKIVKNI